VEARDLRSERTPIHRAEPSAWESKTLQTAAKRSDDTILRRRLCLTYFETKRLNISPIDQIVGIHWPIDAR
jgi:hypothetical protein